MIQPFCWTTIIIPKKYEKCIIPSFYKGVTIYIFKNTYDIKMKEVKPPMELHSVYYGVASEIFCTIKLISISIGVGNQII